MRPHLFGFCIYGIKCSFSPSFLLHFMPMTMIHSNNTTTDITCTSKNDEKTVERIIPLPSVLIGSTTEMHTYIHECVWWMYYIDFIAMTLCDLIPPKKTSGIYTLNISQQPIMPELVFFIQKITFQGGIDCRTALVALIYLERAKLNLPKGAVGGYGKLFFFEGSQICIYQHHLITRYLSSHVSSLYIDRIQIPERQPLP